LFFGRLLIADPAKQPAQPQSATYILLSSEFPADALVRSIQFTALTTGNLLVRIVTYDKFCGGQTGFSCQDYFKKNPVIIWSELKALYYKNASLTVGLNTIDLTNLNKVFLKSNS